MLESSTFALFQEYVSLGVGKILRFYLQLNCTPNTLGPENID